MRAGRVAGASVIVLSSHTLERGGLIDGYRRGTVLILVGGVGVVDGSALSSEAVRLGCSAIYDQRCITSAPQTVVTHRARAMK